jgi:phosphoribosyl-AMP cyclohydrolase / phosphoribosyl-ATP pyrophosphohydrolase
MTALDIRYDATGLVPMIVQDADSGAVLMLGYGNEQSMAATVSSGQVHFWSRSRDELWRKGATSGNTLDLVAMTPDCDGDAVLVTARPAGPACHTGSTTCFGSGPTPVGPLGELVATIRTRLTERPEGSYTVSLVERGTDAVARKVAEEAVEVVMAAKDHASGAADDARVAEEVADLVYHTLVLLAERGIDTSLVYDVLRRRAG